MLQKVVKKGLKKKKKKSRTRIEAGWNRFELTDVGINQVKICHRRCQVGMKFI